MLVGVDYRGGIFVFTEAGGCTLHSRVPLIGTAEERRAFAVRMLRAFRERPEEFAKHFFSYGYHSIWHSRGKRPDPSSMIALEEIEIPPPTGTIILTTREHKPFLAWTRRTVDRVIRKPDRAETLSWSHFPRIEDWSQLSSLLEGVAETRLIEYKVFQWRKTALLCYPSRETLERLEEIKDSTVLHYTLMLTLAPLGLEKYSPRFERRVPRFAVYQVFRVPSDDECDFVSSSEDPRPWEEYAPAILLKTTRWNIYLYVRLSHEYTSDYWALRVRNTGTLAVDLIRGVRELVKRLEDAEVLDRLIEVFPRIVRTLVEQGFLTEELGRFVLVRVLERNFSERLIQRLV